jgi:hypothetical protein
MRGDSDRVQELMHTGLYPAVTRNAAESGSLYQLLDPVVDDSYHGIHTNSSEVDWFAGYKRHIPNQAYRKEALQGYLFVKMWSRVHSCG